MLMQLRDIVIAEYYESQTTFKEVVSITDVTI